MLYHFAKYQLNVAKLNRLTMYCVLHEQEKFGAKIFSHYTDIVIFMLGYFDLAHPVSSVVRRSVIGDDHTKRQFGDGPA